MRERRRVGRSFSMGWLAGGVALLMLGVAGLVRAGDAGAVGKGVAPAVVFAERGAGPARIGREALQTSISARVEPFLKKWPASAVTVGVLDESTSAVLGFGRLGLGSNTPPGPRTIYEIGSMTKVFTATCLELLAERGRVGLDDPVQRCFDPAKVRIPEYQGKKITLAHLATHTSGLPRLPADFFVTTGLRGAIANPYSAYMPEDLFGFLNRCRLERAPGTRVEYSNMGVGLLGLTLARREGVSYEALVRRLVCEPLGLKDTVITLAPEQQARLAPSRPATPNWTFLDSFAGAGALRSTATDMLHFLAVNAGLTSSPLAGALEQTHAFRVQENERMSMGLGWIRTPLEDGKNRKIGKDGKNARKGKRGEAGEDVIIWHNGGTGSYRSFMAFHKPSRTAVVVLSNTTDDEVDRIGFDLLRMMARGAERR